MTVMLPPLFEVKADDEPKEHTGAMIALRPRQDHIDRLAITEGEAPSELHTTILFLGKADDYTYDTRARIIDVMRRVALSHRMVTGNGFYVAPFNPNGEDPCIVLGVGGKEMVDIYNGIVGALQGMDLLQMPEQHEPWIPHVTLAYTDDFSRIPELTDLTGEIVYDAIRVAFGGIVDDIMLQPAVSSDDGYAGGNRYASVATGQMKTQRFALEEFSVDIEQKVRRVRTAAGVRRFGQPIGSVIVADGSTLSNLKTVDSEYEGYEKYESRGGSPIYVRKEGRGYRAYDANDNSIGEAASEEALLKKLNDFSATMDKLKNAETPRNSTYKNLTRETSEYPGYEKYSAPNGKVVYRDTTTNHYYDADDNEVSRAELRELNNSKAQPDPGGLKKVSSEYDGYDKFMGQNDEPVYRDRATGKFYDAEDNEVDVNDYNGEKVKADLTKKPAASTAPAKPQVVKPTGRAQSGRMRSDFAAMGEAMRDSTSTLDRLRAAAPEGARTRSAEERQREEAAYRRMGEGMAASSRRRAARTGGSTMSSTPLAANAAELRSSMVNPDHVEELDAALEKIKGTTAPASVIADLRRLAMRQSDARDRRKLMLFVDRLTEAKVFAYLVKQDPELRMAVLQFKLITPGGRVGTDRSLGSRSNGENWIERTSMGKLPRYIRIVANGLLKAGHSKSKAIAMAVAAIKRWAAGGDNVRPQVQAAAAKALGEWEALKAAA